MRAMWTIPNEENVRAARDQFDHDNPEIEQTLKDLFRQHPENGNLSQVLLKVVAVNALYSTQVFIYSEKIPNVVDIAKHIVRNAQQIDSALTAGSPEIVDRIAKVTVSGKKDRNYLSFATKYCSWHRDDSYPIWDSNVGNYLRHLQKQTDFAADFNLNADWKYPTFHGVMSDFRSRFGLGSFTFKDIDKFLWTHGELAGRIRGRRR
jgi:hypothetical protein